MITAAAAIMVAVFSGFLFGSEVFMKQIGLGMTAAIAIDATIVRMVLVPATMQLLGSANWWIPGMARPSPARPRGRARSRRVTWLRGG